MLDARDPIVGSWHEVTLVKILPATEEDNSKLQPTKEGFPVREKADDFIYHVLYDG